MQENEAPYQALGVEWDMQLRLSFIGIQDAFWSTLVGMRRGEYLICSGQQVPGIAAILNAKDRTIVRYLYRGTVYGFRSTLLGLLDSPVQLFLLSYPGTVETVNLRAHQRISCLIPATAELRGSKISGAVTDLSVNGCRFAFVVPKEDDFSFDPQEEASLSVQIPGVDIPKTVGLLVKNATRQGDKVMLGGIFSNLDGDTQRAVQDYIETVEDFANLAEG
jgi:hypothetical protein